jgi:hypothetical protein
MPKEARIISEVNLDGQTYQPNQVVAFSDKTAKSLASGGLIDLDAEAVAYCTAQLGAKTVIHVAASGDADQSATA